MGPWTLTDCVIAALDWTATGEKRLKRTPLTVAEIFLSMSKIYATHRELMEVD